MKCLLVLALMALPWQPQPQPQEGTVLKDVVGTVVKVGNFGYGLVPDERKGSRYAPTNMDESYHKDGLRVKFSGVVGAVPGERPRGRVWGTPLELTHIELLEEGE